jgi:L-threonylcarbamoyladenylate synthase
MDPVMSLHTVDEGEMRRAADLLRSGGVVAFPTETGYGLGAAVLIPDMSGSYNMAGLERIYRIKQRPEEKPLLVLVDSTDMLQGVTGRSLGECEAGLAGQYWPGPLTILTETAKALPWPLCGDTGRIGVRISSHPVATGLVEAVGVPVTATSANLSGHDMALSPDEVIRQFSGNAPDMILDGGKIDGGVPSTIVDCSQSPPAIVRHGAVEIPPSLLDTL